MKQNMVLEEADIQEAIVAFLQEKGYRPISTKLKITPPYSSSDPRERSTPGSIKYECEVEPSHD